MVWPSIRSAARQLTNLRWLIRCSRRGITAKDRRLAMLLGAVVSVDPKRVLVHKLIRRGIRWETRNGWAILQVSLHGRHISYKFRKDVEADLHIAGRVIIGAYDVPSFKPKAIIDGGANIGTFALHAASLFPEARLVCYEPHPENVELLRSNLGRNKIAAEVNQKGLWSESGTKYFQEDSARTGRIDLDQGTFSINVERPQISEDTWLKLDIEGAEHEVLPAIFRAGALPRHISVEIHEFQNRGHALLELLGETGYAITGNLVAGADCQRVVATLEAQGK